jgi:hypothetical protein
MDSADSGRKGRQHHTSCTLLGIISLLHSVHTSSGYLTLFYVHCTDQITVRLLSHYKLQVTWHCSATTETVTRQCHSEILNGWTSSWYLKSELPEFKAFFQPLEPVSMCFDHTNGKVLPVLRPQISEAFCGFACRFLGVNETAKKDW